MSEELKKYIKNLIDQHKSQEEIEKSLTAVGWSEKEIKTVFAELTPAEGGNMPLPPLPPRLINQNLIEIFANLFSLILLIFIATSTGILYFEIINKYWPDVLSYGVFGSNGFSSGAIHYSVAALLVVFPIYFLAMKFWFKGFQNRPQKVESVLTKWLTYLILLAATATIIGDLISVIYNFLEGELSVRFFLKALVVLVIALLIFGFYFSERKMIQYKKEVKPLLFKGLIVCSLLVVVVGMVVGMIAGGLPQQVRLSKFDDTRSNNLSQINNAINNFVMTTRRMPENLDELSSNSCCTFVFNGLKDPETGVPYEYKLLSANDDSWDYELCANFNTDSNDIGKGDMRYFINDIWSQHTKGRVCKKMTVSKPVVDYSKPTKPVEMMME